MNAGPLESLLPDGTDVPFSDIEATLARIVRDRRRKRAPSRALTATVIVVGPSDRLAPCADAMEQLGMTGSVRSIFITEGEQPSPTARVTETSIVIAGLAPRFLNNAVAALRLSSLPALVWWRGGSIESLTDLAALADRLVLDTEAPGEIWARVDEALELANSTAYGLTAAIWTRSIDRGQEFVRRIVAGGVQVNGPTYGFEPHVPFGGQKDSGTGWREPGTEALDVYSDWKTVYVTHDPAQT